MILHLYFVCLEFIFDNFGQFVCWFVLKDEKGDTENFLYEVQPLYCLIIIRQDHVGKKYCIKKFFCAGHALLLCLSPYNLELRNAT